MRQIELIQHSSDLGHREFAIARPHPALRPYVREYEGGYEHTFAPLVRRELPTDIAPLIINFGAPFRVVHPANPARAIDVRSFVTGAFDSYVLVGSTGPYGVIQVNFTILGARLFLGQPLNPLANRVIPFEEVMGAYATRLTSALYDAPDWAARFDLLDREILARISATRQPPQAVTHALARLLHCRGNVAIRTLVQDAGWSHRHLVARFTEEVGLAPKTLARVLRFGHAAELLQVSEPGRFADIANDCGYYDQAHFTRDFRAFAGVTPTELLASRLPNRGGFTVDSGGVAR